MEGVQHALRWKVTFWTFTDSLYRHSCTGDVSLSAEDSPPSHQAKPHTRKSTSDRVDHTSSTDEEEKEVDGDYDEEEASVTHHFSTSFKFLLAGGIAGAG